MRSSHRFLLLAATALSVGFVPGTSFAASKEEAEIQQLRAQIQALQTQLDKIADAQKAEAAKPAAPAAAPAPAAEVADAGKPGGHVKFTPGGYFEATSIYRSKNETADQLSNFNSAIPFNNSVNAHQGEFRETARGTRLSLLAEGSPSDEVKLLGYVETDFIGAAPTATSTITNSYTPRLRQAYLGYEDAGWGLNVYAGQTYSLLTTEKTGMAPRSEAVPGGIDIGTVVGFTYDRNPTVRVVKTFGDSGVSTGLAFESPQAVLTSVPSNVTASNSPSTSSFSNSLSTDVAPDIVAKVAVDTSFGHYEAFGIGRFFHDNVTASQKNNTVLAGAGGVGAYIPVIPKKLELQGNFLIGEGIGRYGPTQLPDYAFGTDGSIKPLDEYFALIGATAHPTPKWDAYVFAGEEHASRFNVNNTSFGYGDFALNNSGCYVANGTCNAQTNTVWQLTGGFWYSFYKGNYGAMKLGVQDSLTDRIAFSDGNGYRPHALEHMIMTSFRYYPF